MSEVPVLTLIQNELKAPKNQKNDFGKYMYRNCEDILEALKPILAGFNVGLIITDSIELIGDRFYVKATCRLKLPDNEYIEVSAYARESQTKKGMDDSQITGAASSYARKYALNGLFLIDDTKDADSMKPEKETKKAAPKRFKGEIDKFFENPSEKGCGEFRGYLQKEKAPAKAIEYFTRLESDYYFKQQQLIAETL